MRAVFALGLVLLVCLAPGALGATQFVTSAALTEGDQPRVEVLHQDGTRVELTFDLPAISMETVQADGQEFQSLMIPGGGLEGELGAPAIPVYTRFVAIPDDRGVTVNVVAEGQQRHEGMRLMPVQPGEESALVIDAAAYGRAGFGTDATAAAGAPAICAGLRLVPLTLRPVRYDPAAGVVEIAARLRVEIRFEGTDLTNARVTRRDAIPASFDRIYRQLVVNYDPQEKAGVNVVTGTYLLVCPNDTQVTSRLQPLVDWHKRKGYNVVVATTAQTGTTKDQIKSYIASFYNTASPPLEFVGLVGDVSGTIGIPTFNETLSGYNGEGDHPYSQIVGSDILSDVHLGRLSVSSYTELETVVAKTNLYETSPNLSDTGWFNRACLVGDSSPSGYSTIQTMQWIKTRLRQVGYTQIDTVFDVSNFVTSMSTALNRGDSIFSYRFYYGFSGWCNSNTYAMANTNKLHFAVISTCGTGSFAGGTSNSEAFLRAGTSTAPKAGIGAVGTATTGTHTRFNNCYTLGTFQGLLYEDLWEQGAAHTRGKLELYLNYEMHDPNYVAIFSYWNSLMGDPAVSIWTAFPGTLSVTHPASVSIGTNSVTVSVQQSGLPLAGARVCLWKGTEIFAVGLTDAQGECELAVSTPTTGAIKVTVTRHNSMPYQADINVTTPTLFVGYQANQVDDDNSGGSQGNSDAQVSPAEAIELRVQLKNFGSQSASSVTAVLTSDDPYVTITDAAETFGTIAGGASAWSVDDFDFTVSAAAPHGHIIRFGLDVSSGASQWHSLIDLPIVSAELNASTVTRYNAGNGQLDPGENLELSIRLRNQGTLTATGVTGILSTENPWVSILDANGAFGTIAVGGNGENTTDRFRVSADAGTYQGALATLQVVTTFNGTARDTAWVNIPIGTRSSDDPVGPDQYGYFAFDNTDTSYPEAPTYSWVEIDPAHGGTGTQVQLGDYGTYQDKSRGIDLPFTFQFYGEPFNRATICSNGWMAMGDTYLTDYRNWTIPGAGAPQNLIAVFWDDLEETSGGGHVYQKYDAANHRFIVQWSRMDNEFTGNYNTCQAILFDPAHYETPSGDGIILMQYHTVANPDYTDGYFTTGIQNADHTDGVLYAYFNDYAPGAATVTAGRAIKFMPAVAQPQGSIQGVVRNASIGNVPLAGALVHILGTERTFVSGVDGIYAGTAPQGTYDIVCSRAGFEPDTALGINIDPQQVATVDFSLVDIGGPEITGVTQLVSTTDTVGPYLIEAQVSDPSGVGPVKLFYRVGGGGWIELAMTGGPSLYSGQIAGLPAGSQVDYYVQATDALNHIAVDPAGAPAQFYSFRVTEMLYATAAEDPGDPAWQLGVAGDQATSGIWVREDPVATEYNGATIQPEDDHTPNPGVKCFVTGNGAPGGAPGDADVDGGCTTLQSPVFALGAAEQAILRYWRWFGEGGNSADDDFVIEASSDGGSNWTELERLVDGTHAWDGVTIDLGTEIALTDQVVIRFVVCDVGTAGLEEAAIDDISIEVFTPSPAAVPGQEAGPAAFRLGRSLPNPFSGATSISFSLERGDQARLAIFDVQGRSVRRLVDGPVSAGAHTVSWDGTDERGHPVPSGIYFYRLEAGRQSEVRKLIRVSGAE